MPDRDRSQEARFAGCPKPLIRLGFAIRSVWLMDWQPPKNPDFRTQVIEGPVEER